MGSMRVIPTRIPFTRPCCCQEPLGKPTIVEISTKVSSCTKQHQDRTKLQTSDQINTRSDTSGPFRETLIRGGLSKGSQRSAMSLIVNLCFLNPV